MKRIDNTIVALIGIFVVYAILGLFIKESVTAIMSKIVIMTLFALSFNLQFGYSGMASLGHCLFFGMGGYSLVIIMSKFNIPLLPALCLSLIFCAVASWLIGALCLKNNMASFVFLSMGIALATYTAVNKWVWVGGTVGITYSVVPNWMSDYRVLYIFILIMVGVATAILYLLTKSPFVQMLKGVRENEERLIFLGENTNKLRLAVFVISGTFASFAGILYAFRNGGCYTASLDLNLAFQAVIMCVVGGMSTFIGPVLGALLVTLIYNYISTVTVYYELILGVIILFVVYFLREGLISKSSPIAKLIARSRFYKQR